MVSFVGGQMSEMITSALQGYPYPLKAWISHMSNPIYGMTGIHHITDEKLRDPSILPLFIAVDAFMNETTALADYIVPDTHNFESWGFSTPWAGVPTKTSTARWPIIQSHNAKPRVAKPFVWKVLSLLSPKRWIYLDLVKMRLVINKKIAIL